MPQSPPPPPPPPCYICMGMTTVSAEHQCHCQDLSSLVVGRSLCNFVVNGNDCHVLSLHISVYAERVGGVMSADTTVVVPIGM